MTGSTTASQYRIFQILITHLCEHDNAKPSVQVTACCRCIYGLDVHGTEQNQWHFWRDESKYFFGHGTIGIVSVAGRQTSDDYIDVAYAQGGRGSLANLRRGGAILRFAHYPKNLIKTEKIYPKISKSQDLMSRNHCKR